MNSHYRDPMLQFGTDRCQCPTCGLYFNSTYAFGEHRRGQMNARYCLTEGDMLRRGWAKSESGHWMTKLRRQPPPSRGGPLPPVED